MSKDTSGPFAVCCYSVFKDRFSRPANDRRRVFYRGELSNLTGYPRLVNHYFSPPTIFVSPPHSLPACPKHPSQLCPEYLGKLLNQPDTVKTIFADDCHLFQSFKDRQLKTSNKGLALRNFLRNFAFWCDGILYRLSGVQVERGVNRMHFAKPTMAKTAHGNKRGRPVVTCCLHLVLHLYPCFASIAVHQSAF